MKKFKNLYIVMITIFCCFFSVSIFSGCNDNDNNSPLTLATNRTVLETTYEDNSPCFYVEIDTYANESTTIDINDFTYIQDGTSKTSMAIIVTWYYSSITHNGVTTETKYVVKTKSTMNIEQFQNMKIEIVVENGNSIESIAYKGTKITKSQLF